MALRKIVLYPDQVLNTKAEAVDEVTEEIRELVDDMIETMYEAKGIGLAANQVGELKRITVIDISGPEDASDLRVFINPEITARSGSITWEEGCLSIPGIYEKVDRWENVTVKALDRDGKQFEIQADGLLSVALQHEIDHLDGIVFLQHLSSLKRRMAMKKYRKLLAQMEDDLGGDASDDEDASISATPTATERK